MVIEIDSLRKEFDVPGGTEVAVEDFNLSIGEGEFITLVGPSGCGKTTTLRCLAGLETPTSGTISFHGRDVSGIPPNRRNIAMMFQEIALYPHMTIMQNIAYPLRVRDVPRDERETKAREAAEVLGIEFLLDKKPGDLSGGQRQRAALARTMVQDPIMFLMDEPLSDLDAKLKVEIRREIQKIHRKLGKPTLYVTHDQEEAMTMSDRIVLLNRGHIEQVGTPSEMYYDPKNRFVAQFIGNPSMNFFETVAESLEDATRLSSGSLSLDVDDLDVADGSEVTVGSRPDAVTVTESVEDGDFPATVELVEQTGNQVVVTLDSEFGDLNAIVDTKEAASEDETVGVSLDRERMFFFDGDSGERLAREETVVAGAS